MQRRHGTGPTPTPKHRATPSPHPTIRQLHARINSAGQYPSPIPHQTIETRRNSHQLYFASKRNTLPGAIKHSPVNTHGAPSSQQTTHTNAIWREATFGYGKWGGRLPRGDLWCGIGGSGLQRARGIAPTHSRVFSTTPSACYALRVFNGCCNHLSFFLTNAGGAQTPHKLANIRIIKCEGHNNSPSLPAKHTSN